MFEKSSAAYAREHFAQFGLRLVVNNGPTPNFIHVKFKKARKKQKLEDERRKKNASVIRSYDLDPKKPPRR